MCNSKAQEMSLYPAQDLRTATTMTEVTDTTHSCSERLCLFRLQIQSHSEKKKQHNDCNMFKTEQIFKGSDP